MRLHTLGGVSLAGVSYKRLKPLLLLTYLALEGPKDRRYLAELLWPRARNPRQSLSVAISQLRQVAPTALVVDDPLIRADVECDATELLAASTDHDWSTVSDLYAGPFLSGLDADDGNVELEEWLFNTREAIASRAQRAHMELADVALAQGDRVAAVRLADRAAALLPQVVDLEPEHLARLHALLVATGNPRAVPLRREAAELGIDLEPLPETTPRQDGGRLNTHNLPRQPAPFVGRNDELRNLQKLAEEGTRLITLTGLGGIGKSRLALELAWRLQRSGLFDPLYFVPLEAITDPGDLLGQIARSAQMPVSQRQPLATLARQLGAARSLFVLDNFEQLSAAAPAVLELLEACPRMTMVVTSREPLGLEGETLYPLDGLPLPSSTAEALAEGESFAGLSLFLQTARRYDPHFGLTRANAGGIVAICQRLAGSPLGIELAAALRRVMTPEDLALELQQDLDILIDVRENAPERHSGLRPMFESSWQRLTEGQRRTLAGATVFEGGFGLAAAKAVLGMNLAMLAVLMDRSLLGRQGARYDLHPLVKQYAAEKLAERPDADELRERHADYFADLLAAKRAAYRRAGHRVAFEELDSDYPNIRAAWKWAVTHANTALLSRMVTMLTDYLATRYRFQELTSRAELALTQVDPETLLAGQLAFALALPSMVAAPDRAAPQFQRALELGERHYDDGLTAMAHYRLGRTFTHAGEAELAEKHYRAALPLLQHYDDGMSYGGCLCNLAIITRDHQASGRLLTEAAAVCERAGNVLDSVNILQNLACNVRDGDGDYERCLQYILKALTLEASVGRRFTLVELHEWAAYYCLQLSDFAEADAHLREAATLAAEQETWEDQPSAASANHRMLAYYYFAHGDLDEGVAHARRAAEEDDCLTTVAWSAVILGDLQEARRSLAAAREKVQDFLDAAVQDESTILLLEAAVAAMAADDSTHARLHKLASEPLLGAIDHLVAALDLIVTHRLVPQALTAFMASHVVARDLVGHDLLELAATHPAAKQVTRKLAGRRLASFGRGVDGGELTAPRGASLGSDLVIEMARELRSTLQAARGDTMVKLAAW